MTVKRTLLCCGAAAAMIASTAAVAATPASKSVSAYSMGNRASVAIKKSSRLQEVGDKTGLADGTYVIAGLGVIAVVGGVIVAVDNDDDDDDDGDFNDSAAG